MADETLKEILTQSGAFSPAAPASPSSVASLETTLGKSLPDEYRAFLTWSDGGELVGDQAVDFWDTDTIATRNQRLHVQERLPAVILVGSDEGETAIGFDYSEPLPVVIAVPFGDLSPESVARLGDSFGEVVRKVISGDVDLENVCYP